MPEEQGKSTATQQETPPLRETSGQGKAQKKKQRNFKNLQISVTAPGTEDAERDSLSADHIKQSSGAGISPNLSSSPLLEALGDAASEMQKQSLEMFKDRKSQVEADNITGDQLEVMEELGAGNGGVVKKVKHKATGIVMARKMILVGSKPEVVKNVARELKILHRCNSPYIVGFFGSFVDGQEISVCMEYMDGGSLESVIKAVGKIPEPIMGQIIYSVAQGLIYLKTTLDIIHRDVKPSNILVNSKGEIKLCDFGVSGELINSMAASFVGTRSYMAPERLQGAEYNIKSDIWSLGVTIVECAIGEYPIPSEKKKRQRNRPMAIFELLEYIVNEDPPALPTDMEFSDSFRDVTVVCLKKDPRERCSPPELLDMEFVQACQAEAVDISQWLVMNVIKPI